MDKIRDKIKRFLKDSKNTVFLSIGSELRGDDGASVLTANELLKKDLPSNFKVLLGYTAPENLTGEIKRIKPTHMIICDAANGGLKPGEIGVISVSDVDGAAFSTHMMPMNVFIDYISRDNPCKTLILGIQPGSVEFGADITEEVRETAIALADAVFEIVKPKKK
ncbi:MAG: hydrogenase 3 maturation endopeptidase HyCI [Endomicrobium sp.]|jgi:hydrogenase 3 maturation protease|nr:hydrogenase 3 maturation endopeptidase HyCI [Endomicrobium sp.]